MDPLEEQLRQLSLLNGHTITPRSASVLSNRSNDYAVSTKPSCSKVAALVNSLEEQQQQHGGIKNENTSLYARGAGGGGGAVSPKKVGPIVPPKPHKKKNNLPEVPQSSIVKQACEPLYSQRLQYADSSNNKALKSLPPPALVGRAPILQRKQPIYATQNSLYDKTSKVTLDNPAILEQQLEALAHHKKQLERKGLLQQQPQHQQQQQQNISCIPKLSSTSLLSSDTHLTRANGQTQQHNAIYTNMRAALKANEKENTNTAGSVYSNVLPATTYPAKQSSNMRAAGNSIYCNVQYDKDDALDDLPPPPPAVLSIATAEASEYLHNLHEQNDDEIPPPPSPVSSSYSELRRATDVFTAKKPILNQNAAAAANANAAQQQQQQLQQQQLYQHYAEQPLSVGAVQAKTSDGNARQTYMNMNYSNDYNSYSPTLQSISQDSSDYYGYGSFSQGSSTYESIYEPINPRPPSQISARSNYLMYAPYVNGPQMPDGAGMLSNSSSANLSSLASGATTPLYPGVGVGSANDLHSMSTGNNQKEAEVEALTDFLVHSMDAANDVDSYGICYKCNERVLGENSGCTAMDQIYHIACFTCSQCQINLQGKPFYVLEGKPYCEYDYLQTLEKCSVCMKPILERILRATGKPYHPQCFTCVVCGNSLDGIPFTVDATNQNYCIADFHKKFAPRCCVCKEPIMPEPGEEETVRVVALDRSFHFECYKCEDCGLLLSSEAEGRGCYPLDDHVLCKSCNAKRVQMLTNRMTTEL